MYFFYTTRKCIQIRGPAIDIPDTLLLLTAASISGISLYQIRNGAARSAAKKIAFRYTDEWKRYWNWLNRERDLGCHMSSINNYEIWDVTAWSKRGSNELQSPILYFVNHHYRCWHFMIIHCGSVKWVNPVCPSSKTLWCYLHLFIMLKHCNCIIGITKLDGILPLHTPKSLNFYLRYNENSGITKIPHSSPPPGGLR